MDVEKLERDECPIGRALARVGDTWSMLLLREAWLNETRFDRFRTRLAIAPNILTHRLRALTDAGLLEKRRYSERPPRDEYVLTEAGRDFLPVLHALGAWGARHHGEGGVGRLVDAATGVPVDPVVVDAATNQPIRGRALRHAPPADVGGKRRSWLLE